MCKAEKKYSPQATSCTLKGLEGLVNSFFCSNSWVLSEREDGEIVGFNTVTKRTLEDLGCRATKCSARGRPVYRFDVETKL